MFELKLLTHLASFFTEEDFLFWDSEIELSYEQKKNTYLPKKNPNPLKVKIEYREEENGSCVYHVGF